jgi:hypothetical protein
MNWPRTPRHAPELSRECVEVLEKGESEQAFKRMTEGFQCRLAEFRSDLQ